MHSPTVFHAMPRATTFAAIIASSLMSVPANAVTEGKMADPGNRQDKRNWFSASTWEGGAIPNAPGDIVHFDLPLPSARLRLDRPATVGVLDAWGPDWHVTYVEPPPESTPETAPVLTFDNGDDPARLVWRGANAAFSLKSPIRIAKALEIENSANGAFVCEVMASELGDSDKPVTAVKGIVRLVARDGYDYPVKFPIRTTGGAVQFGGPGTTRIAGPQSFAIAGSWGNEGWLVNGGQLMFTGGVVTNTSSQHRSLLFEGKSGKIGVEGGTMLAIPKMPNMHLHLPDCEFWVKGADSALDAKDTSVDLMAAHIRVSFTDGANVRIREFGFVNACHDSDLVVDGGEEAVVTPIGMLYYGVNFGDDTYSNRVTLARGAAMKTQHVVVGGMWNNVIVDGGELRAKMDIALNQKASLEDNDNRLVVRAGSQVSARDIHVGNENSRDSGLHLQGGAVKAGRLIVYQGNRIQPLLPAAAEHPVEVDEAVMHRSAYIHPEIPEGETLPEGEYCVLKAKKPIKDMGMLIDWNARERTRWSYRIDKTEEGHSLILVYSAPRGRKAQSASATRTPQ